MKKLIIGIILGFVLTIPFTVKADDATFFQMLTVLEEINDSLYDVNGNINTLIDKVDRTNGLLESKRTSVEVDEEIKDCVNKKVKKCHPYVREINCYEDAEKECIYNKKYEN